MPDDKGRVEYEVPVSVTVLAPPGQHRMVSQLILNYLRDFIPDETPGDQFHIRDFAVAQPKEH